MRASCIAPTRNVRQHNACPNDVRDCSPRLCDSFTNDFKATDRLPVDIAWSSGTPRRCNRCRPYNNDELANSYGAAKALKPISGSRYDPDEMSFLGRRVPPLE
jgi:hypothetical protein